MYPLPQRRLSFNEIAKHWPRDLPQRPPWNEILKTLVDATWREELSVCDSRGNSIVRQQLLSKLKAAAPHPRILIFDSGDILPPLSIETFDGGCIVDIRKRVHLPNDATRWTPDIVSDACALLGTCGVGDYCDDFLLGITLLQIVKEEFGAFCDASGYERPAFWFGSPTGMGNKARSFGGRPSVMRGIEAEMRRRANTESLAPTLREESKALRSWAETEIDAKKQIPQFAAIENALRDLYRELRQKAAPGHKT